MRALYIRCTAKISLLASPGTWFKVVGPFIISVKSDYSRPCLSIVVSGLVLYGLFFLKSFRFLPHHTHTPVTKLEAQLRGSEGRAIQGGGQGTPSPARMTRVPSRGGTLWGQN